MGDKISQLPSATTLTGTELVPVVQGGTTKQTTSAAFKTTNAADLTTGTVATARLPVGSQVNPGILQLGSLSGQACEATDARLSNSRTPSGAAAGDLTGSYPNPQLAASGVVAGTYGNSTTVPQITVDAKGRLTTVGQASIPIPQPSNDVPLPDGVAGSGNSQQFARADHIHQASSTTLTGDVTGTGTGSVSTTLSNTGVAQGTYGSSTRIPIVTVDAKGRVLAANTVPFSSAAGGTVTSVDVDGGTTGITTSGGPITTDGTITLDGVLTVAHGGTGATSSVGALSSLGAIPLSLVGVSSGVASLDSNGLVPLSQLPNLATGVYATLDGNGKVPLAQLYAGTTNGLATLDAGGKVPSSQLPSYVDDVIEVANFAALPNPGETGKIYITLDTNLSYRWSGSTYIQIDAGPSPSSTTPLIASGTGAIGSLASYARADHVHPSQPVPAISSTVPLVASGTGAIGALTTYARADHVHPAQTVSSIDGGTPSAVGGLIQFRRGTTALWTSANPVLSAAEIGVDTALGALKVGDGVTAWNGLPYATANGSTVRFGVYQVEQIVVAGGGGSAPNWGAGGGAGGYRSSVVGESSGGGSSAESKVTVSPGTAYSVVVGAGGASGSSGSNSSVFGVTSIGGGLSGGSNSNAGASGGSGAGGWNVAGYAGTAGQGYAGGTGFATTGAPGGGGGAGAVGSNGSATGGSASGVGGAGGVGVASSITGSSVFRAGGGGAGGTQGGGAGVGGNGGGGNGGGYASAGTAGSANTGGGAGAGGANNGGGASGGSGVVIIRYPGTPVATGGTITQSGGYTIHTFTSSGTFTA